MIKLVQSLGIAILAAVTMTGCELYFGEPDSTGPDNGGPTCSSNADCAAGCFCAAGSCEEAGFCSTNEDCPDGYHCDDRSSCVPNSCDDATPCPSGQICENGTCTSTCTCGSDAEAQRQGFGYCDEATSTCEPGTDPNGSCAGQITCNVKAPNCAEGEVPLVLDGCYTGACKAIAQCDAAPACSAFQYEDNCTAGSCTPVYTGINCKDPNGNTCTAGSMNCTCENFRFDSCE